MTLKTLENIISACRTAKDSDDALRSVGYIETPYFKIYGHIMDALYDLLGENTETFDESITYRIMEDKNLTNSQRAELFVSFCKNA